MVWPEPHPLCHDSPDAYGDVLAGYFDADFHQFACTGATFAAGISAPETDCGTVMRPAQFGNWANKTDLNAEYDAAELRQESIAAHVIPVVRKLLGE